MTTDMSKNKNKKNKKKSASGAPLWREILPVSDADSVAPHEAHLMGAQQNSYQIGLISKHKLNNLVKLVIEIILILISRINEPPVCAPVPPASRPATAAVPTPPQDRHGGWVLCPCRSG